MKRIIFLSALLTFIAGCSSMNMDECTNANWEDVGFKDGKKGFYSHHFSKREKACKEHGINADFKQYDIGYQKGVQKYCSYKNGLKVGKRNSIPAEICPKELEENFYKGYAAGKNLYLQKEAYKQQMSSDGGKLMRQIAPKIPSKLCNSDFGCTFIDQCVDNKCSKTGTLCTSRLDCKFEGTCVKMRCKYY